MGENLLKFYHTLKQGTYLGGWLQECTDQLHTQETVPIHLLEVTHVRDFVFSMKGEPLWAWYVHWDFKTWSLEWGNWI